MKAKRMTRWLSGSLALALAFQIGTANAFAAVLPDTAETMTETSVTAADPAAAPTPTPDEQAKLDKLVQELGVNKIP